jgi:hypothetical protein
MLHRECELLAVATSTFITASNYSLHRHLNKPGILEEVGRDVPRQRDLTLYLFYEAVAYSYESSNK